MLKINLLGNQTVANSKKHYFKGLKQYKVKSIKLSILPEDKENEKIKSIFYKSDRRIVSTILSFLEFKEIINLKNTNRHFYKLFNNKKILREYILNGSMSHENRLMFYETQINVLKLKQNLIKDLSKYKINSNIYNNILLLAKELKNKDKKFAYVSEQINRDITRTFYNDKFKNGNGKEMLKNILIAMAFIKPEIGYCQGMNFIVGALINFIDNEEKCFWIFLYFIDNIDLKMLYLQNMPDYLIKLYQLNYYIKENYPKLLPHLKKNQISPEIFFSKWILTIFANFLPFEILYNVWDLFILDKWKAIFKFSIIIMQYMKDPLMNTNLYSFSSYLRNKANINYLCFSDLSKYYNEYKVTNKKLLELREDFFVEELTKKLEINNSKWANEQNNYITNYRSELNHFKNNLKRPIEKLQQEISKLNIECEQNFKKYEKNLAKVNEIRAKLEQEIEKKTEYEKVLKEYMPNLTTEEGMEDNVQNNTMIRAKEENTLSLFNKSRKESESIKKRKIGFSFNLKHIIKKDINEYGKITKKLNALNKEIDKNNKTLMIQCQNLDKKQINYEKVVYKRDELKKQLNIILQTSELRKRELIKNLSQQLKMASSKNYDCI